MAQASSRGWPAKKSTCRRAPRGRPAAAMAPRSGAAYPGTAMTLETLLSLKALLVGGVFVFFLVYERLRPAADEPAAAAPRRGERGGLAAACPQPRPVRHQPAALAAGRAAGHGLGGGLQPRPAPGLVERLAGPAARPRAARLLDLLVAPRQPRGAAAVALPPGPSPRRAARQHERAALPLRRGAALGAGARAGDHRCSTCRSPRCCCSRRWC